MGSFFFCGNGYFRIVPNVEMPLCEDVEKAKYTKEPILVPAKKSRSRTLISSAGEVANIDAEHLRRPTSIVLRHQERKNERKHVFPN